MRTNQKGIQLIKDSEGCVLHAYKCIPTEPYYTIGYGHYGSDVSPDSVITQEQAEEMLKKDIVKYERMVEAYQSQYNFNENEFSALVSFCYNIGSIDQLTQYGTRTKAQIADAFQYYVHAGGEILEGLVTRRCAEKQLFITPCNKKYSESSTIKDIVDGILGGEFGNNDDRKEALYELIQGFVNDRFK